MAIITRRQFPFALKRRGIEMRLVMKPSDYRTPKIDQQLIGTVAKGHIWFDDWLNGRIKGYKDKPDGLSAKTDGHSISSQINDILRKKRTNFFGAAERA